MLYYEKVHTKCKLFSGDLTDRVFIKKILTKNFQIIFHLAAQVEVGVANKNPYNTWESNIRGTYTILDSLIKNKKIKSIIVASSDKSYGTYPKINFHIKNTILLKQYIHMMSQKLVLI